MLNLRIRNVLGLERVQLKIAGQVLVGGLNGAGKTSLFQSVAAAALMEWKVRGISQKRDGSRVVREGADEGSILLEYPGGSVRIAYPAGTVDQQGEPPQLGSALGIGAERWMRLTPKARGEEMANRFETRPTREDFNDWFTQHAAAQLDPAGEGADALWRDIEISGWDAIAKRIDDECRELTGQWREVTGQAWGAKVRLQWAPPGLHRGEEYDLAAATTDEKGAQEALTLALAQEAVSQERRRELEEKASKLPGIKAEFDVADEAYRAAQAAANKATEDLDAHPEPVDPQTFPQCPECHKPLMVVRTPTGGLTLEKPARKALSIQGYQDSKRIREALVAAHGTATAKVLPALQARARLDVSLANAKAADAEWRKIEDTPPADDERIVAARRALADAQARTKAIRSLQRAIELNAEWERGRAILEALEPDGIRARVMQRKMAEINVALGRVADRLGMAEVSITVVGDLRYAGRDYDMLSESEQMRADLAMGLLLAEREGASLFLLDRLDLLQPQSRGPVLRALGACSMDVLVFMMAREAKPPALPDLAEQKLGRSVWLGGGKLNELGA